LGDGSFPIKYIKLSLVVSIVGFLVCPFVSLLPAPDRLLISIVSAYLYLMVCAKPQNWGRDKFDLQLNKIR
jgi:hypothetical protein